MIQVMSTSNVLPLTHTYTDAHIINIQTKQNWNIKLQQTSNLERHDAE